MSTNPKEAGTSRRLRLLRILEVLENDLRELSSAKRKKGWYLAIGEILTKAEPVYHVLGAVGFLTEGRALLAHKVRVLEAVAPLVMPHVRKGATPEVREMIDKLGVPVGQTSQSTKIVTSSLLNAVQEMAAQAAKVRSYLVNREEATKWGIAAYDVPDREDHVRRDTSDGARRALPLDGVIDPIEIADIAVRTAKRIQRVPYLMNEIMESDPWPEPSAARNRLDPTRISVDFMSVGLYIERNWTPDHAKKIVSQIFKVTTKIEDFLRNFEAIVTKQLRDSISWSREEDAPFFVLCTMIANEVAQWAAEIRDRARLQSSAPQGSATAIKEVTPSPVADKPIPTLSRPAWVVLKRLVKSPTPMHRKDFAGKPDADDPVFLLPSDEETIGDYLHELIEKGFATRPQGPRRGATATESGQRYVADHADDSAL